MAAIDDLKASVNNLTAAVTSAAAALDDLAAQVAAGNTANDPTIEQIATAIQAQADALNAAVAKDDPPK